MQGPYEYRGSYRPHGQQARDLTVFQVCSHSPADSRKQAVSACFMLQHIVWCTIALDRDSASRVLWPMKELDWSHLWVPPVCASSSSLHRVCAHHTADSSIMLDCRCRVERILGGHDSQHLLPSRGQFWSLHAEPAQAAPWIAMATNRSGACRMKMAVPTWRTQVRATWSCTLLACNPTTWLQSPATNG